MKYDDGSINIRRILLVDDEPDITLYFSMILRDSGFMVDVFNDSLIALSSFKANMYSIAILDIRMPKMNGFDLGAKIKKIDKKIKLAFITAYDITEEDLKEEGMTELINSNDKKPLIMKKPISEIDFVSQIKEELDRQK